MPTKVLLCPRNYGGFDHISHTGLAVSASNTARVLRTKAINALVRPIRDLCQLEHVIESEKPSHVIINAVWFPTNQLAGLVHRHMDIAFVVLIHSNLAFLQVEHNGIRMLHEAVDLELESVGNFRVAANSHACVRGLQDAWECPALYLPNLYYLDETVRTTRRAWSGGTLRIGAFGALRPLKNPTGSAFAALSIATNLGTNLEFHINTGRSDGGWADKLLKSVEAIFAGLPNAKLVKNPWAHWSSFRKLVRHMHLLVQPSFTESFNVVTADGVAEGIPSVVSNVIEWAPDHWKVSPDDVGAIARTGRTLLSDVHSGVDGLEALREHNAEGIVAWERYLSEKVV